MEKNPVKRLNSRKVSAVRQRILGWFSQEGRVLPWRTDNAPWRVLVSEFMLQQTQVDRVIPKFNEFMARWPSVSALAAAPQSEVVRAWSGLGYNRRAKYLWETACMIQESYGGIIPDSVEELVVCPGVGRYTAAAVVSFAFNRDVPLWDTNVRRIFLRVVYGGEFHHEPVSDAELEHVVAHLHAAGQSRDWYSALMDFGAVVCKSKGPSCKTCPLRRSCVAAPFFTRNEVPSTRLIRSQKRFIGSNRQLRGNVMKHLADSDKSLSSELMVMRLGKPVMAAVRELEREGLITVGDDGIRLK